MLPSLKISSLTIALISCLISFPLAQSPQTKFEHLTLDDGLSQSTVFSIMQDYQGFLWLGTMDGLNRYDGYKFTIYQNVPFDSTSISGNWIRCLYEDKAKNIWVGTDGGGLNKFNPHTEKFTRYRHNFRDKNSICCDNITAICEDSLGDLWIGTRDGLNRYDPKNDNFTQLKRLPIGSEGNQNFDLLSLHTDKSQNLWIGTNGQGLFIYDLTENISYHFEISKTAPGIIQAIYADEKGNTWIGTKTQGLYQAELHQDGSGNIDVEFKTIQDYCSADFRLPSNDVRVIHQDRNKALWFGTGDGLCYHTHQEKIFRIFRKDIQDPTSLSDNSILSIYEDRSGNIWFGTWIGGVNRFVPQTQQFKHYKSISHKHPDASVIVLAFEEDRDKNVWIGTNHHGLIKFTSSRDKFTQYLNDPKDPFSLSNNIVQAIEKDRSGNLWIGTWGGGLNRFNLKTGQFIVYGSAEGLSNEIIHCIYQDSMGFLWIGTGNGLNRLNTENNKFTQFLHDPENPHSISSNNIWAIYEDWDGVLWIGTYGGGLNRFDGTTQQFKKYVHVFSDKNSLSNNNIWVIHQSQKNTFWIGTSAGLNKFDSSTGIFSHYFKENGLSNSCIYGILEDNSHSLWLSTNNGLTRFKENEPSAGRFKKFYVEDGLQSNEFNMGAFLKTSQGNLLFGGINGFTSFNPDNLQYNRIAPSVVITEFRKMNKKVNFDTTLRELKKIDLKYQEDMISFGFAALDFTNPKKNKFAYRLLGFADKWFDSGTNHTATFTNLDPGEYLFQVKASNNDGVWSEEPASISIIIHPPFWETNWFRILMIIFFVGVVVLIHRYRMSRVIEMERLRTRIASDLHDDIGANLTKISVYSETLQRNPAKKKLHATSQKIGLISREVIKTFSDIVWSIDARHDSIGDLMDRMHDFAYNLLLPEEINVLFENYNLDVEKKLAAEIRQNLYMIFKEALNNIYKHSNAGEVKIILKNENKNFQMVIADNGKIENPEDIIFGNGIPNMQMRAKRIRANLQIDTIDGFSVSITRKSI